MFDFHIHSMVSFDGHDTSLAMAKAAAAKGLKEICFTDHLDYVPDMWYMAFDTAVYNAAYDGLEVPGLTIRRGMEFGLTPDNQEQFRQDLQRRAFDFVIGSVHIVDGVDVYFQPYWEGKNVAQAYERYLQEILACVRNHEGFDVLGHLTYISKARANPTWEPVRYEDFADLADEILKTLVTKGIGLEINTSGIARSGDFLPPRRFLERYRELGGEIVTVGSDAHTADRVGDRAGEALAILKEIFGHVCTFADRKPIFHTL